MFCVFYISGETGCCKWGGTAVPPESCTTFKPMSAHLVLGHILVFPWNLHWPTGNLVCFVFCAAVVMVTVMLLLVCATALNSDSGTAQHRSKCGCILLLTSYNLFIKKLMLHTCKYERKYWISAHTSHERGSMNTHTLCLIMPSDLLLLSCRRPTHPGETCWSCTVSARYRLHIDTLHKMRESKRGP